MGQVIYAALVTALGAALLMSVQPLATKDCLPLLGGTPAVWAVALVFFQATLLAGYGLAIFLSRLAVAGRLLVLVPLLGLTILGLPPAINPTLLLATMGQSWPWLPLVRSLAGGFFLPVMVVAVSAPVIQAWLARHRPGLDPSPLYAASNAGSLAGLLAYPFLIEPLMDLRQQGQAWSIGYLFWGLGLIGAAFRFVPDPKGLAIAAAPRESNALNHPWVLWVTGAAFPSMLMVALTTHLVTDVAGAPLLGILPLALYLVSFILAFGGKPGGASPSWLGRAMALSALVLALLWGVGSVEVRGGLALPILLLHLVGFLLIAWGVHRRVFESRPEPGVLPWFYLALSAGGVVGGLLAAIVAPIALARAGIWEYPIALAGCCLFQPGGLAFWSRGDGLRIVGSALVGGVLAGVAWLLELGPGGPRWALIVGVPLLLAHLGSFRPGLHAALLGTALVVARVAPDPTGRLLWQERSFFGLARVEQAPAGPEFPRDTLVRLVHGGTIHGQACANWKDGQGQTLPLGYYHPLGPAGDFLSLPDGMVPRKKVAAIGLGVGALAYYARLGEEWNFIEIDPIMERLAKHREWFPFLAESAGNCGVSLGDGRIQMAQEKDGTLDLIILDAFSSDSIPAHLLTREALAIYRSKLAPGGRILAHISNRHLDLLPLFAGLGAEAGMAVHSWWDTGTNRAGERGHMASRWVLLGDLPKGLRGGWEKPGRNQPKVVWTDSHAALWPLVRLGGVED